MGGDEGPAATATEVAFAVTAAATEGVAGIAIGAACFCWLWDGVYELDRGEGPGRARLLDG